MRTDMAQEGRGFGSISTCWNSSSQASSTFTGQQDLQHSYHWCKSAFIHHTCIVLSQCLTQHASPSPKFHCGIQQRLHWHHSMGNCGIFRLLKIFKTKNITPQSQEIHLRLITPQSLTYSWTGQQISSYNNVKLSIHYESYIVTTDQDPFPYNYLLSF